MPVSESFLKGLNMKLSEAIRAGAKLVPQAFGTYYHNGGTCALGAACDAIEIEARDVDIADHFPVVDYRMEVCPFGCQEHRFSDSDFALPFRRAFLVIMHLNDFHKMSREGIAEWVETIEKKLEAAKDCSECHGHEVVQKESSLNVVDCPECVRT